MSLAELMWGKKAKRRGRWYVMLQKQQGDGVRRRHRRRNYCSRRAAAARLPTKKQWKRHGFLVPRLISPRQPTRSKPRMLRHLAVHYCCALLLLLMMPDPILSTSFAHRAARTSSTWIVVKFVVSTARKKTMKCSIEPGNEIHCKGSFYWYGNQVGYLWCGFVNHRSIFSFVGRVDGEW